MKKIIEASPGSQDIKMTIVTRTAQGDEFQRLKTKNEAKKCNVASCTKNRHRISNYCSTHSQRMYSNGNPEGIMTAPRRHDMEDRLLNEVIGLNITSKPVQIGLERITRIIESANMGETFMPFPVLWMALYDRGLQERPKEVLFRVTRFLVIAELERHGEWVTKSDDLQRALIGNAIFALSKIPQPVIYRSFKKKVELHTFIMREIGVLMTMLTKATVKRYHEQFDGESPFGSEALEY